MLTFAKRCLRRPAILAALTLGLAGSLVACQVPVFRYAFERWNPERYQLFVLSPGGSSTASSQLLEISQQGRAKSLVNVQIVDPAHSSDDRLSRIWQQHGSTKDPVLAVFYPQKATELRDQVAHVVDGSAANLETILNSPVRTQVAERLAKGQSAVWILLESGQPEKDSIARATLESQLPKDAQWLTLPTALEMEVKPEVLEQVKVKLKLEFSVLSVRRDDPREQFLIDCLLNSESDLRDFDEPIAIPVFGRGLALYALVGKGISAETIRSANSFICGPCSCQVKEQNPGFDLLMDFDWESAVGDKKISQPIPGVDSAPKLLTIPPGRSKG